MNSLNNLVNLQKQVPTQTETLLDKLANFDPIVGGLSGLSSGLLTYLASKNIPFSLGAGALGGLGGGYISGHLQDLEASRVENTIKSKQQELQALQDKIYHQRNTITGLESEKESWKGQATEEFNQLKERHDKLN